MKEYLLLGVLLTSGLGNLARAEVNVNVNIGVPAVRVSPDPVMAVIPGTYIYFIAESSEDIFFYQGFWWRPYQGRWHRATGFNGPWRFVKLGRVPPGMLKLPAGWRKLPPGHPMLKHSQVKSNWKQWEKEKHWDKNEQSRGNRPEKSIKSKGRGKH
ncbi:hypothetical protein HY768_04825 [candidate division TA06 bacterium]|uniref:Uncharacterized protein n=1 Tax=candidate division TA06 bacterium TaxID=2250710 RepID=A0A933I8M4_UNCT6|nr:hypothetical protein [candidate division TA06 bacterium]